MKKSYLFLFILVVLAGCSSGFQGNEKVDVNKNAAEFMNYGHEDKNQKQNQNVENVNKDEITEQNPNFLNLNTDNETHVNNQGIELNKARDIVENHKFAAGPIWINGQDMFVTAYSNDNLTSKQRQAARTQLRKELVRALPTYHIKVKIENR